jgi:hypothetical protein
MLSLLLMSQDRWTRMRSFPKRRRRRLASLSNKSLLHSESTAALFSLPFLPLILHIWLRISPIRTQEQTGRVVALVRTEILFRVVLLRSWPRETQECRSAERASSLLLAFCRKWHLGLQTTMMLLYQCPIRLQEQEGRGVGCLRCRAAGFAPEEEVCR